MVLTEQKNVLNGIVSDVRHIKSALETIKKDQTKQNKATEDMMAAIKRTQKTSSLSINSYLLCSVWL